MRASTTAYPWGWNGRNKTASISDGRVTQANKELELKLLEERIDKKNAERVLGRDPRFRIDAADKFYTNEVLADYKQQADEQMKCDFEQWLIGQSEHNSDSTRSCSIMPLTKEQVNERLMATEENEPSQLCDPHQKIKVRHTPWGNAPLTHLPGVRDYLAKETTKRSEFEKRISELSMFGPQNVEDAWLYYKYLVRGGGEWDHDLCKNARENLEQIQRTMPAAENVTSGGSISKTQQQIANRAARGRRAEQIGVPEDINTQQRGANMALQNVTPALAEPVMSARPVTEEQVNELQARVEEMESSFQQRMQPRQVDVQFTPQGTGTGAYEPVSNTSLLRRRRTPRTGDTLSETEFPAPPQPDEIDVNDPESEVFYNNQPSQAKRTVTPQNWQPGDGPFPGNIGQFMLRAITPNKK